MMNFHLFACAPWLALAAVVWPLRHMGHPPALGGKNPRSWGLLLSGLALAVGFGYPRSAGTGSIGIVGWAVTLIFTWPLLRMARKHKRERLDAAATERRSIIAYRGTIQQQIMRAREAEAMERRMRRCKSALLLSRGNAEDLDFLLDRLASRISDPEMDGADAAEHVGGMAAHLRHVFMARDQDDLPLREVVRHVDRWARWLGDMGLTIHIEGHALLEELHPGCKVPAMLFLGAAERWGIDALRDGRTRPMTWTWRMSDGTVHLTSDASLSSSWPSHLLKDWDAAFMLRHGGIAHAGGHWNCQLPLLDNPGTLSL